MATEHPRMPVGHGGYIPGFDGLRALAVSGVIASHLSIPGFALGGQGVILFFVLSGFLITRILLKSKGSKKYFVSFYARRAVRIFPIYYLLFGVILVTSILMAWRHDDWLWYATYTQNWKLASLLKARFPPFFNHTWSLAVEEQFYLVWPLLITITSRRVLWSIIAVLIFSSPILRWALAPNFQAPGWMFCEDALAWGAAGALLVQRERHLKLFCGAIGLTLLAICVASRKYIDLQMIEGPIFLCLLLYIYEGGRLSFALEWSPIRYLGRISYGLYLYHPPVLYLTHAFVLHLRWLSVIAPNPLAAGLVGVALTLALAAASYIVIEKPLLDRRAALIKSASLEKQPA